MKKNKKLLKFENDLKFDCDFGDMTISSFQKDCIIPMKKTTVVDNKNKNSKNVGIF